MGGWVGGGIPQRSLQEVVRRRGVVIVVAAGGGQGFPPVLGAPPPKCRQPPDPASRAAPELRSNGRRRGGWSWSWSNQIWRRTDGGNPATARSIHRGLAAQASRGAQPSTRSRRPPQGTALPTLTGAATPAHHALRARQERQASPPPSSAPRGLAGGSLRWRQGLEEGGESPAVC